MKIIPIIALCLISLSAFNQTNEFAPIGAKWWYSTTEFEAGGGSLTITAIKDTIIGVKSCSILIFDPLPNAIVDNDSLLIYQDEFEVYRYFPQFTNFYMLYNFTLGPGDSYFCYTLGPDLLLDSLLVTIVDTTTEIINSTPLKKQIIQTTGSYDWGTEVYEILGNVQMLLPVNGVVEIIEGPLRCYEDINLGHFETGIVADCDEIVTNVIELNSPIINVYPNPAADRIFIHSQTQLEGVNIRVIDLAGSIIDIYSLDVFSREQLNVSHLLSGVYIMHFQTIEFNYFFTLIKN